MANPSPTEDEQFKALSNAFTHQPQTPTQQPHAVAPEPPVPARQLYQSPNQQNNTQPPAQNNVPDSQILEGYLNAKGIKQKAVTEAKGLAAAAGDAATDGANTALESIHSFIPKFIRNLLDAEVTVKFRVLGQDINDQKATNPNGTQSNTNNAQPNNPNNTQSNPNNNQHPSPHAGLPANPFFRNQGKGNTPN
jgi:hypothetical protein